MRNDIAEELGSLQLSSDKEDAENVDNLYVCIREFSAQGPMDLSLKPGDEVVVETFDEGNFWSGHLKQDPSKEGMFRRTSVVKYGSREHESFQARYQVQEFKSPASLPPPRPQRPVSLKSNLLKNESAKDKQQDRSPDENKFVSIDRATTKKNNRQFNLSKIKRASTILKSKVQGLLDRKNS